MSRHVLSCISIMSILVCAGCGRQTPKLRALEHEQIKTIKELQVPIFTLEERRAIFESSMKHEDKLRLIEDITQREIDDSIKAGLTYKIETLQKFKELIKTMKCLHKCQLLESGVQD